MTAVQRKLPCLWNALRTGQPRGPSIQTLWVSLLGTEYVMPNRHDLHPQTLVGETDRPINRSLEYSLKVDSIYWSSKYLLSTYPAGHIPEDKRSSTWHTTGYHKNTEETTLILSGGIKEAFCERESPEILKDEKRMVEEGLPSWERSLCMEQRQRWTATRRGTVPGRQGVRGKSAQRDKVAQASWMAQQYLGLSCSLKAWSPGVWHDLIPISDIISWTGFYL